MTARNRLLISLGVLLAVYWIGVAGYMLLDRHMTLLDSVYMVTITLATVGYQDVAYTEPAARVWTVLLIIFGTLTVAVVVTSLAGWLVESDVGRLFGSKKMEAKLQQLKDHTIVCGFGRMGRLLVDRLSKLGTPLVIIERDEARLCELRNSDLPYLTGDATEEWVLERAGIARAKNVVAALASDADNLFVTLTARQMRPDLYIISRAEEPATEPKLRRAGANRVISPQTIGADWITNVLTRPHVADFVDMAAKGVELEMAEVPVAAGSPLAGKSLRDSDIRKISNIMVVAIRHPDGATRFNPGADEVMQPGDLLITIGQAGAASGLSRLR